MRNIVGNNASNKIEQNACSLNHSVRYYVKKIVFRLSFFFGVYVKYTKTHRSIHLIHVSHKIFSFHSHSWRCRVSALHSFNLMCFVPITNIGEIFEIIAFLLQKKQS